MRSGSLILVAAALVLTTGAAAASGDMTVAASSHATGAKHVRLTVVLRYEMQCGYPGVEPVRLTIPGSIAAPAVRVNGKTARASVQGRTVSIAMPPKPEIMCDVIGPGRLTIGVSGTTNPATAGVYHVTARKGALRFVASLPVR